MNDLQTVINDLNGTIEALTKTAVRLKASAKAAVNLRAEYENKKNQYVLQLKAEELDNPGTKRTDTVRQSMYRLMYKNERLAWQLAEVEYETDRDLFKGLIAKLNALQTVARLTETELKTGENYQ